MRRSIRFLLLIVAAACSSDDLVDLGGDCSGGKECKAGLFCDPRTQTCQRALVTVDARPADGAAFDGAAIPDARIVDGATVDARALDAPPGVNTTIVSGPMGPQASTEATFTFSCSTPPCTFECALDSTSFAPCATPKSYTGLALGSHAFRVRAIDAGNGIDATPAEATFIVANLPVVQITAPAASATVCEDGLLLTFDTVPPTAQVTYTCTRNGTPFVCAEGGVAIPGVAAGANTIVVTARDTLGLSGSATVSFTLDKTPPTLAVTAPTAGATTCPVGQISYTATDSGAGGVTIVDCTLTPASGAAMTCGGSGGTIAFNGLAGGGQTLSLRASDACGNTSDPVTRAFTVDRTGPAVTGLSATAGGVGSGAATLRFAGSGETLADAEGGIAFAALPAPPGNPTAAQLLGSCDCGATSCACTQLAAGQNQLAVRGLDACGNPGPFVTTTVNARYGPYAGHEVQIGHSYSDAASPVALVGNSATLTPWVHQDLNIGRASVRVLAFRQPSVPAAVVTRVTAALQARLQANGVTWRASNAQHYREFEDPSQLASLLRGRDVLLVYDQFIDAFDYATIGEQWGAILAPFTDDGGVAVSLGSSWPALNPVLLAKPAVLPGAPGPDEGSRVYEAFPAAQLGTGNFAVMAAVTAPYDATTDLSCVAGPIFAPRAAPVLDRIDTFCGDGCGYNLCTVVSDEVFPSFDLDLSIDPQPAPGLPDCAQPYVGMTSGTGTVAVSGASGAPPTGTFVCYATGDVDNPRNEAPRPYVPCTVTSQANGSFSIDANGLPENSALFATLISGGEPVRTTRIPFTVDNSVLVSSANNLPSVCTARTRILEFTSFVNGCDIETTLPFLAKECILEYLDGANFVEVARKSNEACGAVPDARGGFASSGDGEIIDWSNAIFSFGRPGTYRQRVLVTDFHGNVVPEFDSTSGMWDVPNTNACD